MKARAPAMSAPGRRNLHVHLQRDCGQRGSRNVLARSVAVRPSVTSVEPASAEPSATWRRRSVDSLLTVFVRRIELSRGRESRRRMYAPIGALGEPSGKAAPPERGYRRNARVPGSRSGPQREDVGRGRHRPRTAARADSAGASSGWRRRTHARVRRARSGAGAGRIRRSCTSGVCRSGGTRIAQRGGCVHPWAHAPRQVAARGRDGQQRSRDGHAAESVAGIHAPPTVGSFSKLR